MALLGLALQSVRISNAHTGYAKMLLNNLDWVCPPWPGSWWDSHLPEQGTCGLSPLPCPQLQKHLHSGHAPSSSSTASPGNLCLPKPAALQLNYPTFRQGGPPCCRKLLSPLLCCWPSRDLAWLLRAGTQPPSEHHSGAAAEHTNNTIGCVLVKRGNFGWEMWGPEQDARVSSITVSGYKPLRETKQK